MRDCSFEWEAPLFARHTDLAAPSVRSGRSNRSTSPIGGRRLRRSCAAIRVRTHARSPETMDGSTGGQIEPIASQRSRGSAPRARGALYKTLYEISPGGSWFASTPAGSLPTGRACPGPPSAQERSESRFGPTLPRARAGVAAVVTHVSSNVTVVALATATSTATVARHWSRPSVVPRLPSPNHSRNHSSDRSFGRAFDEYFSRSNPATRERDTVGTVLSGKLDAHG